MSDNIVNLNGDPTSNVAKPDEEAVRVAQHMLDMALNGEINGFVGVVSLSGGGSNAIIGGVAGGVDMVGNLEFIKAKLLEQMLDG